MPYEPLEAEPQQRAVIMPRLLQVLSKRGNMHAALHDGVEEASVAEVAQARVCSSTSNSWQQAVESTPA